MKVSPEMDAVLKRHGRDQKAIDADELAPLPYVDLIAPLHKRQWLVVDRIPMLNVSLLSGEGAVGKSILLLQLSAATALGKDWLGMLPDVGPGLYIAAEDDADEVNRRLEDIAQHYGATRQHLIDNGLRILSFAGRDAILGQPGHDGIIKPTPLFDRIKRDAILLRPKLIVIDPLADAFAGKEIDRGHVRQFITIMRRLAIDTGSAVVMSSHPSLSGMTTGSGLSGSTAWHNSVRARMYLKAAPGDAAAQRVLEVKKNNYGPVTAEILMRWRDGVYVVEPRQGTLAQLAAAQKVDDLFIKLLRRLTEQGRNVSAKTGTSYAPAMFAKLPEATEAKIDKKAFAASMERLFTAGKIKVITEGPPSKPRTRLIDTHSTDPSTEASSDFHRPSTGVCVPSPYNPPPGGSGHGGGGTPARSTGQEKGKADEHVQ
jgi:RecA-family ATPase